MSKREEKRAEEIRSILENARVAKMSGRKEEGKFFSLLKSEDRTSYSSGFIFFDYGWETEEMARTFSEESEKIAAEWKKFNWDNWRHLPGSFISDFFDYNNGLLS